MSAVERASVVLPSNYAGALAALRAFAVRVDEIALAALERSLPETLLPSEGHRMFAVDAFSGAVQRCIWVSVPFSRAEFGGRERGVRRGRA